MLASWAKHTKKPCASAETCDTCSNVRMKWAWKKSCLHVYTWCILVHWHSDFVCFTQFTSIKYVWCVECGKYFVILHLQILVVFGLFILEGQKDGLKLMNYIWRDQRWSITKGRTNVWRLSESVSDEYVIIEWWVIGWQANDGWWVKSDVWVMKTCEYNHICKGDFKLFINTLVV